MRIILISFRYFIIIDFFVIVWLSIFVILYCMIIDFFRYCMIIDFCNEIVAVFWNSCLCLLMQQPIEFEFEFELNLNWMRKKMWWKNFLDFIPVTILDFFFAYAYL